jgi:hypothetical protein
MSARKKTSTDSSSKTAKGADEPNGKPFEVSHSKIKLARRCLKAYEYRYLRRLQKRVKSRPLIVGSLVHSCLEMYFRDGHYLPAITAWQQGEFSKMFKEEQALHKDILPLAKQLIRGYISNWKQSGLEMVWVEKEFKVVICGTGSPEDHIPGPDIVFNGKIDGKAREIGRPKSTWLVEHKTCKKMPGEEVRIFDTQVLLYQAALELIGEEPVTGVIWDYLRTKLPTRPELLKSGALSVAKSIDTTREVYEREIKRHGLDMRGYTDILETLDSKRDQFYRQVRLPIRADMGRTLLQELIQTSQFLWGLEFEYHNAGLNHCTRNLTRDCSWCDYAPLCHAELRGEDTSYLLKHDYIVRVKHGDQEDRTEEVDSE